MRGAGRVVFVAILLLLVGTLNIIYGIGAVADAKFYVNDTRYVLTNLHTCDKTNIAICRNFMSGGGTRTPDTRIMMTARRGHLRLSRHGWDRVRWAQLASKSGVGRTVRRTVCA
jgi:hypothetical protein